jgi:anti-sigma factor RsiW
MNCNQFAKFITDYVDGTLERGVAGEMEMHMNVCHDCNSLITELENTSSLIRSLDRLTAPEGFDQRLKARIASVPVVAPGTGLRRRLSCWLASGSSRPFLLRPVFAAPLIFVIFAGSTFVLVEKVRFAQPETDWEYIGKCQEQHASFASANPLADDSAIILKERARDLGEEL